MRNTGEGVMRVIGLDRLEAEVSVSVPLGYLRDIDTRWQLG
ncbi:MAG: hypothetical protein VX694_16835 [Planctomycetota bacterium]|nr:hypothetical protein [Planctomycetota bacterium]